MRSSYIDDPPDLDNFSLDELLDAIIDNYDKGSILYHIVNLLANLVGQSHYYKDQLSQALKDKHLI